jgi:hypothetical protein
MRARGLAVFGAPWHPSRLRKLRYFPCAHCLFVDLSRVPAAALDFTPDFAELAGYTAEKASRAPRLLRALDVLKLGKRGAIATSRDTGWRIYEHCRRDPALAAECLQPVFRAHPARAWLEAPVPDRFSLLPKRAGYFTPRGFRERGLPDLSAFGWEEFVWRDAPFGFHVRCVPKLAAGEPLDLHRQRVGTVLDLLDFPEEAAAPEGAPARK